MILYHIIMPFTTNMISEMKKNTAARRCCSFCAPLCSPILSSSKSIAHVESRNVMPQMAAIGFVGCGARSVCCQLAN